MPKGPQGQKRPFLTVRDLYMGVGMFAGIAAQFLAPRFIQPPPPAVWLYPLVGIVGGFVLEPILEVRIQFEGP